MSEKDCGNHGHTGRKIFRRIFAGILLFLFLVLVTILIIWAVLQPKKPRFILQDATLYAFNVSSNTLTSTMQVTVASRNPNDKIGIYYDRLDIYATYHDQQVTLRTAIPQTYQGHLEVDVWSPFLTGVNVPIAPYNALALGQDQGAGAVLVTIKLDGRVRFKVGAFVTGKYHLYVNCRANLLFGSRSNGVIVENNGVKYQLAESCSVSV